MKRHRSGPPPKDESSSEGEDDAFSALTAQKSAKRGSKDSFKTAHAAKALTTPSIVPAPASIPIKVNVMPVEDSASETNNPAPRPFSLTSSMKRHHVASTGTRKSKMEALLEELKSEKTAPANIRPNLSSFVPQKKGSYVEAGEELLTPNIFVGNLATHVTEEQLGDLFRQFGDLYSIKIMWPRGDDEARFRGRHTGFVCFLRRSDAESAMRALDDTDPFACGRRLKLRWGKNILKRVDEEPHGNPLPTSGEPRHVLSAATGRPLVRVSVPEGLRRDRRIRAVAACVAQNGSSLEDVLREQERHNPEFDFLDARGVDHPYYKWRVYAACQGDPECRRTAPFAMLRGGCLWTVPSLATVPGLSGGEPSQSMAVVPSAVDPNTALAASRADGSARLTAPELEEARRLFRIELSASRRSVCRAMAFCYDKAHAAQHVSELLRDLLSEADADADGALVESDDGAAPRPTVVSAETLVSRLYLVSDVLFNAQQPGVRGAFRYRTAVEGFAPDAFAALGRYGRRQSSLGHRWTRQHKVLTAVHVVLQAWSKWAVYHGSFLADLQARFDGKDLEGGGSEEDKVETADESQTEDAAEATGASASSVPARPPSPSAAREDVVVGHWADVGVADNDDGDGALDGEPLEDGTDVDGEPLPDGDALDGVPLDEDDGKDEVDGESLKPDDRGVDDPDGEPLNASDEDLDGVPLDDDAVPVPDPPLPR